MWSVYDFVHDRVEMCTLQVGMSKLRLNRVSNSRQVLRKHTSLRCACRRHHRPPAWTTGWTRRCAAVCFSQVNSTPGPVRRAKAFKQDTSWRNRCIRT